MPAILYLLTDPYYLAFAKIELPAAGLLTLQYHARYYIYSNVHTILKLKNYLNNCQPEFNKIAQLLTLKIISYHNKKISYIV